MARSDVLERRIERMLTDDVNLNDANLAILNDYDKTLRIERKSLSRRYIIIHVLRKLAVHTHSKQFSDMTKDDLIDWVASLNDLSHASMNNYMVIVKSFFKWLHDTEDYPECVKWIKLQNGRRKRKLPSDMITPEEVKAMINHTDNARDKALIAVLYESACRVGEIANMNIKDVVTDQYGAVVMVDGKTGMRRLRLIDSSPYIAQWIDQHPTKDDRDGDR